MLHHTNPRSGTSGGDDRLNRDEVRHWFDRTLERIEAQSDVIREHARSSHQGNPVPEWQAERDLRDLIFMEADAHQAWNSVRRLLGSYMRVRPDLPSEAVAAAALGLPFERAPKLDRLRDTWPAPVPSNGMTVRYAPVSSTGKSCLVFCGHRVNTAPAIEGPCLAYDCRVCASGPGPMVHEEDEGSTSRPVLDGHDGAFYLVPVANSAAFDRLSVGAASTHNRRAYARLLSEPALEEGHDVWLAQQATVARSCSESPPTDEAAHDELRSSTEQSRG